MIYDISLAIDENLPTWPGDPARVVERAFDMERGDEMNVTHISASVHTGTHIDAPRHFIADGATIEQLDLHTLIGPALVVENRTADSIGSQELAAFDLPAGVERLLLKTRNSDIWARGETEFQTGFVAIDASGAEWLVERGIKLVGIDYLSVAPYAAIFPTHRTLLSAQIVAVEGLNLDGIEPGEYQLICLPIKLTGSEGAPARVVLLD